MPTFSFEPNQTIWSAKNALSCAMASQLAYSDAGPIDTTIKTWGFDQSVCLNRRETYAFVAVNQDMILVSFRGTEPAKLADWMTDADIALTGFTVGRVHTGFLNALTYVWADLTDTIKQLQTNAQSLWFTGHSLGASLATLATAKLRLESSKPVNGLYTFGSPRVGDGDFQSRFDQDFKATTFRYVNNVDVVTRVPPRVPLGYRHVGTFLFFDENGNIQSDIHWWNQFLDSVGGDVKGFLSGQVAPLDDHFIANYIARCDANLGKNPF